MREGPFVKTDVAAHGCFLALALAATCALLPFADAGLGSIGIRSVTCIGPLLRDSNWSGYHLQQLGP